MNAFYKWVVIYLKVSEKRDSTFKDGLDFDLQSYTGTGTLESGIMMWMLTPQGSYGLNIIDFW